ncbi:DUF1566 domain-containing protein [Desulfobacterales bacterium HSG16]|nr:DUF1566 domain-containing protein [Desulfobacterales bacterium HSG16]
MKQHHKIIFLTIILVIFTSFSLFAWPIPDSGLTKCYNDTEEIPCPSPGDAFYGQDGNYSINSQSYTKLDANGNDLPDTATDWVMVRDNVTSLIWEVKQNKDAVQNYSNPHDADNGYTWYDSDPETNGGDAGKSGDGNDTEDFINALNAEGFGGHNDWRLPTIRELGSIVDSERFFSVMDDEYFPNTHVSPYLSSTTYFKRSNVWDMDFESGNDGWASKYSGITSVRAVRDGRSRSFDH